MRGLASRRRAARVLRVALLLSFVLALTVWGVSRVRESMLFVHESDARIAADMVTVSSRIAGRVVERPVEAGSRVAEGDLLAVIDSRDARARLAVLEAELALLEAAGPRAREGTPVLPEAGTGTRPDAPALPEAGHDAREAGSGVPEAGAKHPTALHLAAATLPEAGSGAGEGGLAAPDGGPDARPAGPAFPADRPARAARRALVLARMRRQQGEVADHVVTSPRDGVVSRTFVEAGEYVAPGQRIALLHDPRAVYVEANVRETEIRRLRPGQSVRVEVDAYPDRIFEGRVVHVGLAATSAFALLPSPNPSGNFTKVTQRFPVRIAVEQEGERLRPGMMVEVFIHAGDE